MHFLSYKTSAVSIGQLKVNKTSKQWLFCVENHFLHSCTYKELILTASHFLTSWARNLGLVQNERYLNTDYTSASKSWKVWTYNDLINVLGHISSKSRKQTSKKSIKIFLDVGKLSIFSRDLKSITKYLSFETNPRVLAQFV